MIDQTSRAQAHSVADLQELLRENKRIHARGNGSKPALHGNGAAATTVELTGLRGILEYQPSEYTVTARAGTAVAEVAAALAQHGQYLPFDPLLPASATLGGTVASNLAGSRRFRYGGVRDFILGARVVDGLGRSFQVGGKVVKNAAGFDLSKFLVGSLGRYAIMTELTFKVFPDVPHFRSLQFRYPTLAAALAAIYFINQSVYELDALDLLPAADGWLVLARLGGFAETLPARASRFSAGLSAATAPAAAREIADTTALWNPLAGVTGDNLVKVVLAPKQIPALDALLADCPRRYGVGGNVAWVAPADLAGLAAALEQLGLTGLCLRGDCDSPIIGRPIENVLADRVKQVLDPENKLV